MPERPGGHEAVVVAKGYETEDVSVDQKRTYAKRSEVDRVAMPAMLKFVFVTKFEEQAARCTSPSP